MIWAGDSTTFNRMLASVRGAETIAIDTEADSLHSYFDKVCLIQISCDGEDWVVDPLAKFSMEPLRAILADTSTVKVLHGADYDLRILNRDFGFELRNIRDTMVCAQLLGYEAIGLAGLLDRHFGAKVNKTFQRADWAQRPLTSDMLRYAAMDTHYLVELVKRLEGELTARGRWEWALEEFERLEAIRHTEPDPDPDAFRLKGSNRLDRRQLAVLAQIHAWRDRAARAADRPPFKIANNETLIGIAEATPRTLSALKDIRGMSAGQAARFGTAVLAAIERACAIPDDELPEISERKRWVRDRELDARIERLKKVRDGIADELEIEPGLLAPRHVLAAIATASPSSAEDLGAIPAMRRWQIAVAGERFVSAIR